MSVARWTRVRRRTHAYDEVAPVYDRWKWQTFWRRNEAPVVAGLLAGEPIADLAVDLGAGTGALGEILSARSRSVVAVDASGPMLRELARHRPAVPVVQGDVEALPFADGVFGRAGAARLLSHLDDPLPFLREVARVTGPRAAVVVSDLHPDFEYERSTFGVPGCSTPFTPTRHPLRRIADAASAAGLAMEEMRTFGPADLLWRPPVGEFETLDANAGPIFYAARLRRP